MWELAACKDTRKSVAFADFAGGPHAPGSAQRRRHTTSDRAYDTGRSGWRVSGAARAAHEAYAASAAERCCERRVAARAAPGAAHREQTHAALPPRA